MRILVTGGAGFIGSNLVRRLVMLDHEVLNFDSLTYAGSRSSLDDLRECANHKWFIADICDSAAVAECIKGHRPQWIMHLAAESHVDRSIDSPNQFIETNVVGTFNLLHSARMYWSTLGGLEKDAFRFLHVSTDEVYGSLGATGLFTEETPYDPHSPYSASKAASDHLVRSWFTTYQLPTLITNCSNNYGPFQFPEKLIPVVILKSLRGEPIPVYGTGQNIRDWLYVEDHCAALLEVIRKGTVGETYNIGGNNEMRNIDLVKNICRSLDQLRPRTDGHSYTDQIAFVADRPGHDLRYAIDSSKIRNALGWSPNGNHQELLAKTVKWYLDNESWWQAILKGDYRLDRQGKTTV